MSLLQTRVIFKRKQGIQSFLNVPHPRACAWKTKENMVYTEVKFTAAVELKTIFKV